MSDRGHKPRSSEDAKRSEARRPALIRELSGGVAALPPPASKITLPGYRLPPRRRAAPGGIVREVAAVAGSRVVPERNLPDAALGSFGSPIVREVVLGVDDRVKISGAAMSGNPFRQICALRIRASTGAVFVGTGWFIGPNAIATAGHCVFLHREGGWPSSIDVIPAKFGNDEPFGQVRATKFRSVDGWIEDKGMGFDYGLILLEGSDLGERLGWFEVAAESTQELDESVANISGYPADRDHAAFQYFHARPLSGVTEDLLEYDIDTFGGQSGSPVWVERDQITVIGIHTNGASSGNSGTRITEPVIDNFLTWMGGA